MSLEAAFLSQSKWVLCLLCILHFDGIAEMIPADKLKYLFTFASVKKEYMKGLFCSHLVKFWMLSRIGELFFFFFLSVTNSVATF